MLQASVDHSKRVYNDEQICLTTVQISQEQEENASNAARLNEPTKQWKHQQKHKQFYRHDFKKEELHKKGESTKTIDGSAATVVQWRIKPMKTSHQT